MVSGFSPGEVDEDEAASFAAPEALTEPHSRRRRMPDEVVPIVYDTDLGEDIDDLYAPYLALFPKAHRTGTSPLVS